MTPTTFDPRIRNMTRSSPPAFAPTPLLRVVTAPSGTSAAALAAEARPVRCPQRFPVRCAASASAMAPPPPPAGGGGQDGAEERESVQQAGEGYEDFARMLGPEKPHVPADELLSLLHDDNHNQNSKSSRERSSPDTRPDEYASFEELLLRSGGTGRPPKAVAKFLSRRPASAAKSASNGQVKNGSKRGTGEDSAAVPLTEDEDDTPLSATTTTRPSPATTTLRLTDAEIADGYGMMDELFGNKLRRPKSAGSSPQLEPPTPGKANTAETTSVAQLAPKPRPSGQSEQVAASAPEIRPVALESMQQDSAAPLPPLLPKPYSASMEISTSARNSSDLRAVATPSNSSGLSLGSRQPSADTRPWTADEVQSGYAQLQDLFGAGRQEEYSQASQSAAFVPSMTSYDASTNLVEEPALQEKPIVPSLRNNPQHSREGQDLPRGLEPEPRLPDSSYVTSSKAASPAPQEDRSARSSSPAEPPAVPSEAVAFLVVPPARRERKPVAVAKPGEVWQRTVGSQKEGTGWLLKLANPRLVVRPPFRRRAYTAVDTTEAPVRPASSNASQRAAIEGNDLDLTLGFQEAEILAPTGDSLNDSVTA